jgi:heptosyltransferase II
MKILIIQTAFIGDLILTTGFIRQVSEKFNSRDISIVVNEGTESILTGSPFLKKTIPLNKKKIKKNPFYFINFLREIRSARYDLVLSPHFSHRSSLISYFSGSKTRIGYKEAGFSFLHTKTIHRPILGKHEIEKLASLIDEEIGYPPEFHFKKDLTQKIENEIHQIDKPFIALAPSSVWETKKMPEEKFIELIEMILNETKFKPILIGSKSDVHLSESIIKKFSSQVINFTGKTNLIELAYLISKSTALISNDSSPIHIASAYNVPTVQIYGATIPNFGYTSLSKIHYFSEIQGLDCRPCGIHGGRSCPQSHFKCMRDQNLIKILSFLKSIFPESNF